MKGSISTVNRFKISGRADSSASSRFIFKIEDETSEKDLEQHKQAIREELANEFEKNYKELEILGEGCSSVVKKCLHLKTKETRAVKIIRSDDDEYIEIAKKEF